MTQAIIKPQTESEIADAVREGVEKSASFEILSHGTKRGLGRPVAANTILDVSALAGIVKYEPEELVLSARAATPLAEIEAALVQRGQMLGFEPTDWGPLFGEAVGRATLAGIAASNSSGPRRVKAGAVRDHLIACRFVNGAGEIVKAGGPVIKNVTGFDVTRLMCGAFGTLGVLTELTFRVSPAPPHTAALAFRAGPKDGLKILREALCLPLDPTGLTYIPDVFPAGGASVDGGAALIRVEGAQAPLNDKLERLKSHFAAHEAIVLDADTARSLFRDAGNGALLSESASALWRLCVPPADAHAALEAAKPEHWYADWAGGALWLALPASAGIAARLREITGRFRGHATLMRGSAEARTKLPVFEPEPPAHAALTKSVKEAFDSKRIFNPGRMVEGI